MSREVRRVPAGWQHPTAANPYWREQQANRTWRAAPESHLHAPEVRFVGLCGNYPARLADWQQEVAEVEARRGHSWTFSVKYHLTGYQGSKDTAPTVHPFYVWSDDGETEGAVDVRDEDHLHELLTAQKAGEQPDAADYMPVFDVPADELGWCLYETVSEGTPVTPVFATAGELVDHLATVGQDWDQRPMRRSAAEQLVQSGGSLGSFVMVGGALLQSDTDADVIAGRLGGVA